MREFDTRPHWPDVRRKRADAIVHLILSIVSEQIDRHGEDWQGYAARELLDQITTQGMEVVTDADRAIAGLPPRGLLGWTAEELAVLEAKRFESLLRPISVTIPAADITRKI